MEKAATDFWQTRLHDAMQELKRVRSEAMPPLKERLAFLVCGLEDGSVERTPDNLRELKTADNEHQRLHHVESILLDKIANAEKQISTSLEKIANGYK